MDAPTERAGSATEPTGAAAEPKRGFPVAAMTSILVLGAAARIALLLAWDPGHDPPGQAQRSAAALYNRDEQDYNKLAKSLLQRGQYALLPGSPTAMRPPLYPVMLAGIYSVAGVENLTAVRIVQAGMGLVLVLQVYLLAARMFNRRTALAAAAVACFYPSLIGFGNLLLSELLFTVLFCQGLLALQSHLLRPSFRQLAACGVLFGLATLTRSVLWPFIPVLAVYLFFAGVKRGYRRGFLEGLTAALAMAITIAPWTVRNTRLERTFTPVDTLGGRNMMMGNYEHTLFYRSWDTITVGGEKKWSKLLADENPGYQELTQGQRDKLAMKRGIEYALAHPLQTIQRDIVKFFNFWQLERTLVAGFQRGYWMQPTKLQWLGIAAVVFGAYCLCLVSGIFGFCVLPPTERRLHWFLLLVTGFVCAVHTAVFAHSRYHLSLMPLVFPYSAHALLSARSLWQRRSRRSFWIAVLVSLTLIGGWVWEVVWIELPRLQGH